MSKNEQSYNNLGGYDKKEKTFFFPILQQDGITRINVPVKDFAMVEYLRKHDR